MRRRAIVGLLCSIAATLAGAAAPAETLSSRLTTVADEEGISVVRWDAELVDRLSDGDPVRLRGFPMVGAGETVDLELERFSITRPGTRFVVGSKDGPDVPLEFDPSRVLLLRGTVAGKPGSRVFLALSERGSTGIVVPGPGAVPLRLASRDGDGRRLLGGASVFRAAGAASLPPDVPLCGIAEHETPGPPPSVQVGSGPRRGLRQIELAVETDYEFFTLFDDLDDASTYLVMMYAQVGEIFRRDVGARVDLVFARLWDQPDDLFNVVNPSPLSDFRSYWNSNMGAVNRDVAQLLSGRRDYPFGGQAYLSTLCGGSGYSVVGYALGFFPDPTTPSPYHYDISVTAHELGHNAGTGHTHSSPNNLDTCNVTSGDSQRGTIMSYCGQTWSGGNANRDLYFHSVIQQNMRSHIQGSSCVVFDCNQNGVDDAQDIGSGTSVDSDTDGVPDECEDCNGNDVLDDVDISSGASSDVNGNGVPDECEPDCDGDGTPDDREIEVGTSIDAYGNDIPDECETDCNTNGTSDYTEIQADMALDLDRNAALDACQDCDGDGTSDIDELNRAHGMWVASGLSGEPIRHFYASTGVKTGESPGGGAAQVDEGQDLVVTATGRVLVASGGDDRVLEFDAGGSYLGDLVPQGSGGLDLPSGLLVLPGNRLLVSSRNTDEVLSYDLTSGVPLGVFAPGAPPGGLVAPTGLALGPDGSVYVASGDDRILRYDEQSGAYLGEFVSASANGGLDQPKGMTFKPDGNLLVASFGSNEVLEFEGGSGVPMGKWAQVGTPTVLTQDSPWGIRVGPNGNVFVGRTGEDFGSQADEDHHHDEHQAIEQAILERVQVLHLSNAQVYEYDVRNGNFLRMHVGGNDHGLQFPTGFDFVPGWAGDCNYNLVPDACDVASGSSADLDGSGAPDECETDCNTNGRLDRLDLIPFGTERDCNYNSTPDSCDIAQGSSHDCNDNGVPDECEPTDDFETDQGWIAGAPGDTATDGLWVRVDPNGTGAQPEADHTPGSGTTCWVTGQGAVGGADSAEDVDGGRTTLLSPVLDLSFDPEVAIGYWRWFSNSAGANPEEDVFRVDVSDDGGASWTNLETVGPSGFGVSGGWTLRRFRIADLLTPTATMQFRFVAEDVGGGSTVEAGVDDFFIDGACPECLSDPQCDDARPCTIDRCETGTCQWTVAPGSCLIGDACYLDGELNPADPCQECDPASPADWSASPAGEVDALVFEQPGVTRLSWSPAGNGAHFDLAGGTVGELGLDGGVDAAGCVADDVALTTWDDLRPDPPSGGGYYYVIRAQKSCSTGTYGTDGGGAERLPVAACP